MQHCVQRHRTSGKKRREASAHAGRDVDGFGIQAEPPAPMSQTVHKINSQLTPPTGADSGDRNCSCYLLLLLVSCMTLLISETLTTHCTCTLPPACLPARGGSTQLSGAPGTSVRMTLADIWLPGATC